MKTNRVREKMRAGQPTIGCFLGLGSPNVAELLAHAGFDWLVIETEHNGLDSAEIQHMLMAISGTDTIPLVRIPSSNPVFIQRFMRKHHQRIPYLHLKSVDSDKQRKVEAEDIPFAIAVGQDLFVEPSAGAVDFIAFRDLLREINFEGFGIVEQDMFPAPFDKPLPIAKRTRKYLREIGLG